MELFYLTISTQYEDIDTQLVAWISAIVVLLVVEACTSNLTTIWFALGAVVAAALAAFGIGIEWQLISFICASALMLFLTKPLVKKLLRKKAVTNKDNLIGIPSYVTEKIDNIAQTGYVKINDVYWAARSVDNSVIEEGALVEVKEIQGNKLIVSTIKGDN